VADQSIRPRRGSRTSGSTSAVKPFSAAKGAIGAEMGWNAETLGKHLDRVSDRVLRRSVPRVVDGHESSGRARTCCSVWVSRSWRRSRWGFTRDWRVMGGPRRDQRARTSNGLVRQRRYDGRLVLQERTRSRDGRVVDELQHRITRLRLGRWRGLLGARRTGNRGDGASTPVAAVLSVIWILFYVFQRKPSGRRGPRAGRRSGDADR